MYLSKIRDVLRRADIEGLIAVGAPDDEYDDEAKLLAVSISDYRQTYPGKPLPEELLVSFLMNIWQDMFDLSEEQIRKREQVFVEAARAIMAKSDATESRL